MKKYNRAPKGYRHIFPKYRKVFTQTKRGYFKRVKVRMW